MCRASHVQSSLIQNRSSIKLYLIVTEKVYLKTCSICLLEKNILGLNITMNDSMMSHELQSVQDLNSKFSDGTCWETLENLK